MDTTDSTEIWLEVSNIRFQPGGKQIEVQLKGDRADREPVWRKVARIDAATDARDRFRDVTRGLDEKKIVLARLAAADDSAGTKEGGTTESTPPTAENLETTSTGESPGEAKEPRLVVTDFRIQFADSGIR